MEQSNQNPSRNNPDFVFGFAEITKSRILDFSAKSEIWEKSGQRSKYGAKTPKK